MPNEDDYLLLSQLTHAGYCLRRAGLVMNGQLWKENSDTAKGRSDHERVHTQRTEHRGDSIKLYECDVSSAILEVRGKCDCLELTKDASGCRVPGVTFPVRIYPVEFKHGKVRDEEEYNMQLCAQAMCLEEMYQTTIPEGAIFYTSSHRRQAVCFSPELRQKVLNTIAELKKLRDEFRIPPAQYSTKCIKCSMQEFCMPKLAASAQQYCTKLADSAKQVELL